MRENYDHTSCWDRLLVVSPSMSAKPEALPRGTETLLLVDDEDFLRKGFSELLGTMGYMALIASSGDGAPRVARAARSDEDYRGEPATGVSFT
jgi:hypothetical protein